ncbi:Dicer-like protein 1 [Mycena venus]|uniref:Dicer-like protein 1 n=1 Tax=Mycena venus TaxID=2733690 RepID=A0A8H6Y8A4_9AGAR|nr:Dicer-like protein 1 [Mycena venus]
MPPKRKRAEDAGEETTSSTRATRSSARQSAGSSKDVESASAAISAPAKNASTTKAASKATAKSEAPAAKKAKTTAKASASTTKTNTKKTAPKKSKKAVEISDEEPSTSKSIPLTDPIPSSPISPLEPAAQPKPKAPAPTAAPVTQASVSKIEPYSPDRAASLFKKYADEDDPSIIGPEGFSNLCTEAQIPLDGAGPLILAWQLNAKEMGKFTKEEWTKGTETLKISSLSGLAMAVMDLEKLLIQGTPTAKGSTGKKEPYDKFSYGKYAADPKAAFQTLYTFCFTLAKPEQSRNIDMETSTAFWSVLLVPQYPIMSEVLEFINEKGTYKATNKDLWSMMLEFCRTVKPTLQDYEADGTMATNAETITGAEMRPRHYQEEVLELAQKSNTIAALDTGAGKTFIGLLLLKWISAVQPRAKSIFLVPKVPLVEQQGQFIASHSALRVLRLHGALEIDLADRSGWIRKFENHDVFVMTPQIFLNLITHSLWAIDKVALIIFDECHHARKNHPYNGIMREYFEVDEQRRPKIFGMTASPVCNIKDASGSLAALERNLDSKVVTVHNHVDELAEHVPKVIKQYPSPPEEYDFPSPTLWACLSAFKSTFDSLNLGWDEIERRYANTLFNLGPYCASMYLYFEIDHRISHFRESDDITNPLETFSSPDLSTEVVQILDILSAFDHLSTLPVCLEWCSPKIRVLVDILLLHQSQQCMIFVEQRQVAVCLAKILPCIPVLHDVVRCAELVGQGADSTDGFSKNLSKTAQDTLQSFREGSINLIIATAVAEEGLDLPACDLVIRFDPLQHIIGYVQCRGRARNKASTFVMMVEENDSVQLARYKTFSEMDPELKAMYQSRQEDATNVDNDMDEDEVHPTDLAQRERYVVSSTNAVLSYDNAINLLSRLCALIPHDAYTSPHTPKYSGEFQAVVQLPSRLPLAPEDLRYQGPQKLSKKEAKRAVAFLAVKRLHELDVFDQYLLPVPSARKGHEENDGTPLLNVGQIPNILRVSVKDPWTTDESQKLWIHPIFIDNRHVAGLVTGTELFSVELDCGPSQVRTSAAKLVELEDSHQQREIMYLFTKECIWYRITGTPIDLPLGLYLVPIADTGQPDFPAMEEFLASPRGNPDWTSVTNSDCGHLMVVNVNLTGHTYILRKIRCDLSPSSVPPDDSQEAGFPTYRDYWVHKWTGKPGSRKKPPCIPEDGPLLELSPFPRSKGIAACGINSKPFNADTDSPALCVLFPRDCCRWVHISEDVREALDFLPAIYHRASAAYRARRARASLSLPPISDDLLVEALTLPCAQAGYSNQRLETLGDAVLQICTTVHLFNRYKNRHEGQLSVLRRNSVCNHFLLSRAKEIGLETFLTCETLGVRTWRDSIQRPILDDFLRTSRCTSREFPKRSLQDCMEATLGASFVTGGIDMALHSGRALGLDFGGPMPWNIRYGIPDASPVPSVFSDLEETLGYSFRCGKLLLEALTHPSFDNQTTSSYERLEFLGDAILDLVVIDYLYRKFPDSDSDQLAWPRTRAICAPALAYVAVQCLKLHQLVLINNVELSIEIQSHVPQLQACTGEEIVQRGWQYDPPKALSDIFESVVGAVLVDSNYNYERTASVVEFVMQDVLEALHPSLRRDPITELMEWAATSGCISNKQIVFKYVFFHFPLAH